MAELVEVVTTPDGKDYVLQGDPRRGFRLNILGRRLYLFKSRAWRVWVQGWPTVLDARGRHQEFVDGKDIAADRIEMLGRWLETGAWRPEAGAPPKA